MLNSKLILKILLSSIFIFSVFGKLLDLKASTLDVASLLGLDYYLAQVVLILLIGSELILTIWIYFKRIPKFFLSVPIIFLISTVISKIKNLDCGCFGELPIISGITFESHLMLVLGIFMGFYYLSKNDFKTPAKAASTKRVNTLIKWSPIYSIFIILLSYCSILSSHFLDKTTANFQFKMLANPKIVENVIYSQHCKIIDARNEYQYSLGHIPNALNIPYNHENIKKLCEKHKLSSKVLIVYCTNKRCNAANILAKKLKKLECSPVNIYTGGWEDWVTYKDKSF